MIIRLHSFDDDYGVNFIKYPGCAATKQITCRRYRLKCLEYLLLYIQINAGSLKGATSGSDAPVVYHSLAR